VGYGLRDDIHLPPEACDTKEAAEWPVRELRTFLFENHESRFAFDNQTGQVWLRDAQEARAERKHPTKRKLDTLEPNTSKTATTDTLWPALPDTRRPIGRIGFVFHCAHGFRLRRTKTQKDDSMALKNPTRRNAHDSLSFWALRA
jgi:hypothetical protein